jgi:hypothetical protein
MVSALRFMRLKPGRMKWISSNEEKGTRLPILRAVAVCSSRYHGKIHTSHRAEYVVPPGRQSPSLTPCLQKHSTGQQQAVKHSLSQNGCSQATENSELLGDHKCLAVGGHCQKAFEDRWTVPKLATVVICSLQSSGGIQRSQSGG